MKKVQNQHPFAVYSGMTYQLGDPKIDKKDNSYQIKVPGTQLILDAQGLGEESGKAQFMNDCFNYEAAGARIRQAPGQNYCLAFALGDQARGTEIETTYDGPFWCRKKQWDKLSEADKLKAGEAYNITLDMIV